jgi:DNA-binding NtrC family response regulator
VSRRLFREDLYFRLSVFPVTVPPLRERTTDIPILASHFIERFSRDQNKKTRTLSPAALDALLAYPWPGNVRELQNCLERAVILAEGETIQPAHLQLSVAGPGGGAGAASAASDPWSGIDLTGSLAEVSRRVLGEVEKRKLTWALREAGGDRTRAAALLEVPLRFLQAKLKDYHLG